jgi:hypothetical protein
MLTCRDDFARYRIECPPGCEVKRDEDGTDFLVVPDPADAEVPYWLFDDILVAAAQDGEFGLRLVSVDLLN